MDKNKQNIENIRKQISVRRNIMDAWELSYTFADGYQISFAGTPGWSRRRVISECMDDFIGIIITKGRPLSNAAPF
ncbi:hypothetical protein [Zhenhengia sp.]|uniref:hypothetical protein n=1 Tax=Zhenhengia sp. TaxID=2944208 RepID=UPI00307ABD4F